jgi:hypothetical protein
MNWLLNLKMKTENLFETLGTNCPAACCYKPEDLLTQQWDSGNFSYSSEYISFWLIYSLIPCVDAWFIILGIANSLERKYGILFYKIINNLLSHLTIKSKSVLVFWFIKNLMHTNFSVTFLITLYAIWGSVPQYYAEEWIDFALWLLRCKREILLCSSTAVTCQKFGCHVWTCLISTITATTALVERIFPAPQEIKTYPCSIESQDRYCQLSLLSIDMALVAWLQKTPNFNNVLIEKFTSVKRKVKFNLK